MELQINIGLGNNPFNYEQASALATAVLSAHGCFNIESRKDEGVYIQQEEDNVVMKFNYEGEYEWMYNKLAALSLLMNQDCIAWHIPKFPFGNEGVLVYSNTYGGEKYTFDLKYFKKFN